MYPKITLVNSQEFRTLDLQIKGRHLKKKQKKNMVYLGFFLFCILHRNPRLQHFCFTYTTCTSILRLHCQVLADQNVDYFPFFNMITGINIHYISIIRGRDFILLKKNKEWEKSDLIKIIEINRSKVNL